MDSTLTKLEKTNKIINVMGDFSINLLVYDSDSKTNDFINTMVSHYFRQMFSIKIALICNVIIPSLIKTNLLLIFHSHLGATCPVPI